MNLLTPKVQWRTHATLYEIMRAAWGNMKPPQLKSTMTDQRDFLRDLYLDQFREASQYISTRLEAVHTLHNFSLLLAGSTGAAVSVLTAVGSLTIGVGTLDIHPFLSLLLVAPCILVPSALMILRNHFFIDVAELFIQKDLASAISENLGTGALGEKPHLFRVSRTRDAFLGNQNIFGWVFMGAISLAEYAVPFAMSMFFIFAFYLFTAGKQMELYQLVWYYFDIALLVILVSSILVGRIIRPHEKLFNVKASPQP